MDILPGLSQEAWSVVLDKERRSYEALRSKFMLDPSKQGEAEDWTLNNPLSLAEDSPWKQYFSDMELRKVIMQDVERTFPESDAFRDAAVQKLLTDVLFTWCKLNPDVSYRQGMHELLAIVFLVVDNDKNDLHTEDELFQIMFDARFVEHDTAVLFFRLMQPMKKFYDVNESQPPPAKSKAAKTYGESNKQNTMPIISICKRIQYQYVAALDPEVARHIESHSIEPQLYCLRWIRLLFAREFSLTHVFVLWDGLFAYGPQLELTEWVAVAMLLHIRHKLLASDYSETMFCLMRYPATEGDASMTSQLIQSACVLLERYHHKTATSVVFQESDPDSKQHKSAKTSPKKTHVPWLSYEKTDQNHPEAPKPTQNTNVLQRQGGSESPFLTNADGLPVVSLKRVQDRDLAVATHLSSILSLLENIRASDSVSSFTERVEKVIEAVQQVKHIIEKPVEADMGFKIGSRYPGLSREITPTQSSADISLLKTGRQGSLVMESMSALELERSEAEAQPTAATASLPIHAFEKERQQKLTHQNSREFIQAQTKSNAGNTSKAPFSFGQVRQGLTDLNKAITGFIDEALQPKPATSGTHDPGWSNSAQFNQTRLNVGPASQQRSLKSKAIHDANDINLPTSSISRAFNDAQPHQQYLPSISDIQSVRKEISNNSLYDPLGVNKFVTK